MTKKIFIIGLLFLSRITFNVYSQDVHFSQFYMAPIVFNPANSGTDNNTRAFVNYRSQWSGVSTGYKTMLASFDMKFRKVTSRKKNFWAGGVYFFKDKAGITKFTNTKVSGNIAYNILINKKSRLAFGMQISSFQRNIDFSNIRWETQYDGFKYNNNLSSQENFEYAYSKSAIDIGSGLSYVYKKTERYSTKNDNLKIVSGVAVHHLNQPSLSFQKNNKDKIFYRWVGYVNSFFGITNTNTVLNPSFLFMKQGPNLEIMLGGNILYNLKGASKHTGYLKGASVGFGGFIRARDAIVVTMLLNISNYSIGCSYDFNTSKLSRYSQGFGGFEISLKYSSPTFKSRY